MLSGSRFLHDNNGVKRLTLVLVALFLLLGNCTLATADAIANLNAMADKAGQTFLAMETAAEIANQNSAHDGQGEIIVLNAAISRLYTDARSLAQYAYSMGVQQHVSTDMQSTADSIQTDINQLQPNVDAVNQSAPINFVISNQNLLVSLQATLLNLSKWQNTITTEPDGAPSDTISLSIDATNHAIGTVQIAISAGKQKDLASQKYSAATQAVSDQQTANKAVPKLRKIICFKGKNSKKIIGANPICPSGFKKK